MDECFQYSTLEAFRNSEGRSVAQYWIKEAHGFEMNRLSFRVNAADILDDRRLVRTD